MIHFQYQNIKNKLLNYYFLCNYLNFIKNNIYFTSDLNHLNWYLNMNRLVIRKTISIFEVEDVIFELVIKK